MFFLQLDRHTRTRN